MIWKERVASGAFLRVPGVYLADNRKNMKVLNAERVPERVVIGRRDAQFSCLAW